MLSTGLRIGDRSALSPSAPHTALASAHVEAEAAHGATDVFAGPSAAATRPVVSGTVTSSPSAKPTPTAGAAPAVAGTLAGGPVAAVAAVAVPALDVRPLDPRKVLTVEGQIDRTVGAREQMASLSPPEREAFLRLATRLYDGGIALFRKPSTSPDLLSLLASGRLRDTDSRGATVLDNLSALASQPLARGFDSDYLRGELLTHTVAALARPDHIAQGSHGTCTATTIEYAFARRDSAEYTRLVSGLFRPEGEVPMRNGDTLVRPSNIHFDDGSGRSPVSRVFQAAIMDYASGPLTHYDNYTDLHTPLQARDESLHGTYKGLFPWEVKRALEALTPHRYDTPLFRNEDIDRAEFRRRTANAPADQPLPVSIRWSTPKPHEFGLHMLLLERVDDTHVYLRNPQGAVEDGATGPSELDLAPREAVGEKGSGHIRMTHDAFYDRLYAYFAPSDAKTPPTDTVGRAR